MAMLPYPVILALQPRPCTGRMAFTPTRPERQSPFLSPRCNPPSVTRHSSALGAREARPSLPYSISTSFLPHLFVSPLLATRHSPLATSSHLTPLESHCFTNTRGGYPGHLFITNHHHSQITPHPTNPTKKDTYAPQLRPPPTLPTPHRLDPPLPHAPTPPSPHPLHLPRTSRSQTPRRLKTCRSPIPPLPLHPASSRRPPRRHRKSLPTHLRQPLPGQPPKKLRPPPHLPPRRHHPRLHLPTPPQQPVRHASPTKGRPSRDRASRRKPTSTHRHR